MRARAALLVLAVGCARPSPSASTSVEAPVGTAPATTATSASTPSGSTPPPAPLVVTSPAFTAQGAIPRQHTCEADDRSPPLELAGVPPSAKTLAVIMDDPDAPDPAAPKTVWVHWVAYDLPAGTTWLAEGAGNDKKLGRPGKNDWGKTGYRGPCPPIGRHRYFVKVLALDTELGDLGEPTKAALTSASAGHVVGAGELVGTYQKAK